MFLHSNTSKVCAVVVAKWQVSLVSIMQTRISWRVDGLDMINKNHNTCLQVIIFLITHKGDNGIER